MKLKTFRANSMADALAAVKSDLGRDAVILHTRTIRTGGFLGLGRKTAVEVTASDEAPAARKRNPNDHREPARPRNDAAGRPMAQPAKSDAAFEQPRPLAPVASALKAYSRSAPSGVAEPRPAPMAEIVQPTPPSLPPPQSPLTPPRQSAPAPAVSEPGVAVMRVRERTHKKEGAPADALKDGGSGAGAVAPDIRRELSDIKLLVSQVLKASGPAAQNGGGISGLGCTPDALFTQYQRLLEAQVGRDIADRIVGLVRDELHPGELTDESIVRTTVLRHLSSMIQVAPPSKVPTRSGGRMEGPKQPFVVALVGPTGVGKTTTVAKLAATYKLRQGRSVGLITSDTYRIAAVDQLRTYADIIGLPLRVVQSPAEMAAAVQALSSLDVVLIDTAGRSQHNIERLSELAAFVTAAQPDETHLVLSSTAAPEVLFSAADSFAVVKPNRVILTKLDEAVQFGVVVNIMQRLSSQLSFVTTGQEVPDHIEPGNPDRIARLIMDRRVGPSCTPSEILSPRGAAAREANPSLCMPIAPVQ